MAQAFKKNLSTQPLNTLLYFGTQICRFQRTSHLPLSKGSFQETLSEPKDSVDTVVQKLNLSQTHLYELKNWKKNWSCQPASIDNISDFHLFTILPPQHTEILIPNCQPTCLDDGRRDVQQVLYEGYSTSESNAQIRSVNAILPALLKFWT